VVELASDLASFFGVAVLFAVPVALVVAAGAWWRLGRDE
jgi:hypothetical protein